MTLLIPKRQIIRDPAYRRYVASLPCMACGIHGHSQCAHISHGNFARSMKAGDDMCVALCCARFGIRGCHAVFDDNQPLFAEHCLGMTIEELKAHAQAMYAGWAA